MKTKKKKAPAKSKTIKKPIKKEKVVKKDAFKLTEVVNHIVENKQPDPKPIINRLNRNKVKYQFNGETYGKGKLVLTVVKSYVEKHPKATLADIKKVFPDELQKYYGVIAPLNEAKKKSEHYPRYFVKDDEIIKLADTSAAVCTQWDSHIIPSFLLAAKKAGFAIKEVK